ncbi:MAG: hypothetical protein AAGA09_01055 [Pseudomonadota bacterium]
MLKYTGVISALAALMAGCGNSSSNEQVNSQESAKLSSDEARKAPKAAGTKVDAKLRNAALDPDAVFGRLEPVETSAGPCPWLSDETALGAIKTQKTFVRREVSNDTCIWNYNSGFEVSVRVEPLASAKPVSERFYNFDSPPELSPQSGPGSNATILLDPTWNANNPRPYAFAFEQSGELVFIKATGVETSVEGLRSVANEIAQRKPDAASIERQLHSILPAFDPCTVWDPGEVATQIDPDSHHSSRRMGDNCVYSVTPKSGTDTIEVQTSFIEGDAASFEKITAKDFADAGVTGFQARIKHEDYGSQKATVIFALHPQGVVGVTLQGPEPDYDDLAKLYLKNLLDRLP